MQSALSATAYGHTFEYAWLGTQEPPFPWAAVACHCRMTVLLAGRGVIKAMTPKNAEYQFTRVGLSPTRCLLVHLHVPSLGTCFLDLRVHRQLLIVKIIL